MTTHHEAPTETLMLRSADGGTQPSYRLSVTAGPDFGKTFVIDGSVVGRVLLGKGTTSHFRLTDPAVSGRHLALWLDSGGLSLEDLGSTNGTRIGSLLVRQARLAGGESIGLARTAIFVEALVDPAKVVVARQASFGRVLGASVGMRAVFRQLDELARRNVPMLIEGEAGTGKELVAEAIHEEGPRRDKELCVYDPASSSSPENAMAHLFGNEEHEGLLGDCRGGTLVIDEITELPMPVQSALARLLEGHTVTRPSGGAIALGDVRVIALSRNDVERAVQEGRMSEALASVIGGARVELPPLRERRGDVSLLANAFFRSLEVEDAVLAPLTLRRFEAYSWPGNVRELKVAVHRAAFSGDDRTDPLAAFQGASREASPAELYTRLLDSDLSLADARQVVIDDFERRFVARMLDRHNGNVTRAAAASGIARRYFQILRNRRGV